MRPWLGRAESDALAEVIASGWVAQGPGAAEFERELSDAVGAAHGVAVSSGTAALHLALVVSGGRPRRRGDRPEPLVHRHRQRAPVHRRHAGVRRRRPGHAEPDPRDHRGGHDAAHRAVILVHQAGIPADIAAVHELCDARGIAVVEDAACALGATYHDTPIGSHSDLVIFSFHPRKVITTGEGGMVMTSRDDWADRLRRLRDHGASVSAWDRAASSVTIEGYVELGFNYRLSDLLAAVGRVQLTKLDAIVARRRELAAAYQDDADRGDRPAGRGRSAVGTRQLPVVLGRAPGHARGEPRRSPRVDARTRDRRPARHHGRAPRADVRGASARPLPVTEHLTRRSVLLPLFHEMTADEQTTGDRRVPQRHRRCTPRLSAARPSRPRSALRSSGAGSASAARVATTTGSAGRAA